MSEEKAYIRRSTFRSSTKLEALASHLIALRSEEATFKAVVFSQFMGFLDFIEKVSDFPSPRRRQSIFLNATNRQVLDRDHFR